MEIANIAFDDVQAHSLAWMAWVFEDERWIFRELSEDEKKNLLPLLDFDLSYLKGGDNG